MKSFLTILSALAILCGSARAELRLAGAFGDHMILQRDVAVSVWGWADAGERVTVEFAGQKKTAVADGAGKWSVKLDSLSASAEPRTLTVTGSRVITKTDVLVGDVWLCSGQSNMGMPMNIPNDYLQRRIRAANNPQLRLIQIAHNFPDQPTADLKGNWQLAQSNTVGSWIAIGYLFGDKIQTELSVPVGIIAGAMGGTPIESWMAREVLLANPANAEYLQNYERAARITHSTTNAAKPHQKPTVCFNGKIAPLAPFAIRGVLWYQGESNLSRFEGYPSQIADLMRSWRALFGLPKLPFIMTELAPFRRIAEAPEDNARARFGEGLAKAAKADGNAWVITIVDGGDPENIHPVQKEIPGERFAAMALAKVYGRTGVAHGPVLESWKAGEGRVVVKFSSVGGRLTVKALKLGGGDVTGDAPHGFELAGADRKFFRAAAKIEGKDTVVVSCPEVSAPVAVRYAWAGFPLCNLFNQEGFAAYPFRTDDWPFVSTDNSKK